MLYRIPVLGGPPTKLLTGLDSAVTFSPDGQRLAFVRGDYPTKGESALMIAQADGSGEQPLAMRKKPESFSPIWFTGPSWSPDGELIACALAKFEGYGVAYTPEGKIVFSSDATGQREVWMADADGANRRQLTNQAGYNSTPSVSPDGRYIAFVSERTGNRSIWRMDINGSNPVRLTSGPADAYASFSPDGQWVVYLIQYRPARINEPPAHGAH